MQAKLPDPYYFQVSSEREGGGIEWVSVTTDNSNISNEHRHICVRICVSPLLRDALC